MGQTQAPAKPKPAPTDSLGISRDDAGAMTALFSKLATSAGVAAKGKPPLRLLSESSFIEALHLPDYLQGIGNKLYAGFAQLAASTTTTPSSAVGGGLTEAQFFKGVAVCTKEPLSKKLQFLFSLYEAEGQVEGTDRPELRREAFQQMFLDLVLLSTWLSEHPDLRLSDAPDEDDEGKEKETGKTEETNKGGQQKERRIGEEKHYDRMITAMVDGLMTYESMESVRSTSDGSTQSIDGFVEWVAENVPHMFTASIEVLMNVRFLPFSRKKCWKLPHIDHARKSADLLDHARVWALSVALDEETDPAPRKLLYATYDHGASYNRFCHAVLGYGGPTLMLIKDSKSNVFGAYITTAWQDNLKYYGNSGSILFSLYPKLAVYRSEGSESNYVFCNTHKSAYSDVPVGIGFGGSFGKFRLWIDGEFATGNSRSIDSTYRKGPLVPDYDFKIAEIVVWGLGGDEALLAQAASRQKEANEIEKRRKVDKNLASDGWNSGADKWMMDMVGKTGHSDEFQQDLEAIKEGKKLDIHPE